MRPHAARIACPVLAIAGGDEAHFFSLHARELADAAGPERGTCHIVEGANHYYDGHRDELFDLIEGWLAPIAQASVRATRI